MALWYALLDWVFNTRLGQWWDEHVLEPWEQARKKGDLETSQTVPACIVAALGETGNAAAAH